MIREQFGFFKAKGLNRFFSEDSSRQAEEENYNCDKDKIMNLESKAYKEILIE